jgi:3-ketoacyl-CoA synthase
MVVSASSIRDMGNDEKLRHVDSDGSLASIDDPANHGEYRVRRSRLIGMVNWWHVAMTFYPHVLVTLLCYLASQITFDMMTIGPSVPIEIALEVLRELPPALLDMSWRSTLLGLCLVWYLARHHHPVYLVDFVTFEPPESWRLTHDQLMTCMRRQRCFTEESISFLRRILNKSGTGQRTAWPPGITQCLKDKSKTADKSVEAARKESETVICDVVKSCLQRTRTLPTEVDILIVNCSLFSPTPSLCAMIMNHFKMRGNVMAYNLSGMGCSASLIGIELAQNVLGSHPNKVALVVSTENLTQNLYHGNDRSMLLQNTLFRCGGAAILLSNKWRDGQRAKFKLLQVVRTQGTGDEAYDAVYECQDVQGEHGVKLDRNIVNIAGRTMEKNFTVLGPYVLPLSEQTRVIYALAKKKLCKYLCRTFHLHKETPPGLAKLLSSWIPMKIPAYVPDFKRGIDYWCIHAGGRAVVDGVAKNLKLHPEHAEPSKYALYNYGNTSSSSIWYEMDYVRKVQKPKKGHRVLQVAFGSGFKCNSAVWLCLNE